MKLLGFWLLLTAAVLVGGCSSTRVLMPTPNIYADGQRVLFNQLPPDLETTTAELLYVTDRLPETNESNELEYGYERSASAAFGKATVKIGESLSWRELAAESQLHEREHSLPLQIVAVDEVGRFPETPLPFKVEGGRIIELPEAVQAQQRQTSELERLVTERLAITPRKEVIIFVHGYNTDFENAAYTLAELWHFLGREGVPLLYTWPAGRGGWSGYAYDRESGEFTIFHLKQLLRALASFDEVDSVSIVAHSRGTDVVSSALRELVIEDRGNPRNPMNDYKLKNVVLAAADLDIQIFRQRLAAEHVGSGFGRVTIYTSQGDKAIRLSTVLFDSLARIGQAKVEALDPIALEFLDELENFDIVDNRSTRNSFFGHGYFTNDPAASSDLINVIRYDASPGVAHGRPLEHIVSRFWYFTADYPAMPLDESGN